MAPQSSTFAWQIPWMEEPGRLQSMGLRRVGYGWATSLSLFTFMHWRRKWQPTPVFLPGESQGRGSPVGCHLWGPTVGHDWSDLAAAAAVYYGMCHILNGCKKWKWKFVTQSCLILYNPIDCSLPGSSVHGILQATVLEWVVISLMNTWCLLMWVMFLLEDCLLHGASLVAQW